MSFKVTRFAPTPSGYLHLGNIYSFLITKVLAKKHQAKILLRIDDLDSARVRDEYLLDIFESLEFMELDYDFGPKSLEEHNNKWSQIRRKSEYKKAIEKLIADKALFACTCSRKKIKSLSSEGFYLGHCLDKNFPMDKAESSLRLNTEGLESTSITRYPEKKIEAILPPGSLFPIIRKKDREPAYHLASIVDDFHFGVDLIIRGKDLYSSTLSQSAIAKALGKDSEFSNISFLHHELLLDKKGNKISKSEGDVPLKFHRDNGMKVRDVFEQLGRQLGLNHPFNNFSGFEDFLLNKMATQS